MLACGADITQINTIRKRLSGVKGGRFAQLCAPAHVYAILLSDVIGDPPDMIASGPAYPDSTTTAQAMALVSRYGLTLSPQALDLLEQEPPKVLDNVTTVITGQRGPALPGRGGPCGSAGLPDLPSDGPAPMRGQGSGPASCPPWRGPTPERAKKPPIS